MGQDRGLQKSLLGKFFSEYLRDSTRTDISVFGQGVSINYQHREVRELFRPAIRHLEMTGLTGSPDLEIFCFVSDKPPLRWLREKGLSTRINQTIHLSTFRYCYRDIACLLLTQKPNRAFYWSMDRLLLTGTGQTVHQDTVVVRGASTIDLGPRSLCRHRKRGRPDSRRWWLRKIDRRCGWLAIWDAVHWGMTLICSTKNALKWPASTVTWCLSARSIGLLQGFEASKSAGAGISGQEK